MVEVKVLPKFPCHPEIQYFECHAILGQHDVASWINQNQTLDFSAGPRQFCIDLIGHAVHINIKQSYEDKNKFINNQI